MRVIRFTSLKALPFIILAAILGWSCDKDISHEDEGDEHIIVSNVFTPNGQHDYNYFEVTTKGQKKEVSLKIYTRTGVLVFSIEARQCVWDGCSLSGQQMAAGIYHYTAEVCDSSPKVSKSGFIHLYR